jgi:hypothetical protein
VLSSPPAIEETKAMGSVIESRRGIGWSLLKNVVSKAVLTYIPPPAVTTFPLYNIFPVTHSMFNKPMLTRVARFFGTTYQNGGEIY